MSPHPLVTVVCLCYNHEAFVREALESVTGQTYGNLEVIIVDDSSTDESATIIRSFIAQHPSIRFIQTSVNSGNCKAFNKGLAVATGDLIVDFATDDILLPDRVEKQVRFFSALSEDVGVVFTDAEYVDANGGHVRFHFEHLRKKRLLARVPQGDVYRDVLSTYFIPSPTMMATRAVFDALGGYDETLAYEDFDFWVRSSRYFRYAFLDAVTTRIRISERSMSKGWYKKTDPQLHSTYLVCRKALSLNRDANDVRALSERIKYEIRQAVFSENMVEAELFYELLKEIGMSRFRYRLLIGIGRAGIPLRWLRSSYHRWRFG